MQLNSLSLESWARSWQYFSNWLFWVWHYSQISINYLLFIILNEITIALQGAMRYPQKRRLFPADHSTIRTTFSLTATSVSTKWKYAFTRYQSCTQKRQIELGWDCLLSWSNRRRHIASPIHVCQNMTADQAIWDTGRLMSPTGFVPQLLTLLLRHLITEFVVHSNNPLGSSPSHIKLNLLASSVQFDAESNIP